MLTTNSAVYLQDAQIVKTGECGLLDALQSVVAQNPTKQQISRVIDLSYDQRYAEI